MPKLLRRGLVVVVAIVVCALVALLTIGPPYVDTSRNYTAPSGTVIPVSSAAQAFHDSLEIVDWHADTLLWRRDITKRWSRGHLDLPRMAEGNIALQGFAVPTKAPTGPAYGRPDDNPDRLTYLFMAQLWPPRTWDSLIERADYMAGRLANAEAKMRGKFRIIRTRSDLDSLFAARNESNLAMGGLLSLEGAHALEGDIKNLDRLYDLGYRIIGLHHFFDNKVGGSLHGLNQAGLTEYGRQLVLEIEARGLVLDLAHSSVAVVEDVISMTDMPLIVSHTGLHSHCESRRNISDELMKRVVRTGGVVAIGFWSQAVCDTSALSIAHAISVSIQVLGEDHVSIGSDFDGNVTTSFDAAGLSQLTASLIHVGLSEAQIRKVMGGNALRVLRSRLPE